MGCPPDRACFRIRYRCQPRYRGFQTLEWVLIWVRVGCSRRMFVWDKCLLETWKRRKGLRKSRGPCRWRRRGRLPDSMQDVAPGADVVLSGVGNRAGEGSGSSARTALRAGMADRILRDANRQTRKSGSDWVWAIKDFAGHASQYAPRLLSSLPRPGAKGSFYRPTAS